MRRGEYDEAYIDYLIRILRRIKDMDLKVCESPRSDLASPADAQLSHHIKMSTPALQVAQALLTGQ